MARTTDMAHQRLLLNAVRSQFSSNVQPQKQKSYDRVVTIALYTRSSDDYVTAKQIRTSYRRNSDGFNLNHDDIVSTLDRLLQAGKVESGTSKGRTAFRLTQDERNRISDLSNDADNLLDRVVNRLFKSDIRGPKQYKRCFLETLANIFGQIGEESARLATGHTGEIQDSLSNAVIEDACSSKGQFSHLDSALLRTAVEDFFNSRDPDCHELSLSLSQNYFVSKMLGFDKGGTLLSKELFRGSTFLLDTNVVIAALEPYDEYHDAFLALFECLSILGSTIKVSTATLQELTRWVDGQRSTVIRTIDLIPNGLMLKINSPFIHKYHDMIESGSISTIEDLFENFQDPELLLKTKYGIIVDRDEWFTDGLTDSDTVALSVRIREKSKHHRRSEKREAVALHDALCLLWIQRDRQSTGSQTWFITRDRSLTALRPDNTEGPSLAITMDALLQWIFPIAGETQNESDFVTGFSKLISERLLPRDRFLDIDDFIVFDDLNIQTKSLPEKDVEECLREVNRIKGTYRMNDPAGREQLSSFVNRFFLSPDRQYKEHMRNALQSQDQLRRELELAETERQKSLERVEAERVADRERIKELEETIKSDKELGHKRTLKSSGLRRLVVLTVLFTLVAVLIVYAITQYADGLNNGAKILANIGTLGCVLSGYRTAVRSIVGDDRLKAIGWSIVAFFGVDP